MLHSLPLEFPLAMAFAEQLLSWKSEDGEGRAEDEPDTIPTSVLLQVVELLGEARHPRDQPGKLLVATVAWRSDTSHKLLSSGPGELSGG